HAVPFHFRMTPLVPTAQTLFASLPHTPVSSSVVPLVWAVHVVPFHFRIVPLAPTTQTLFAPVPQIPASSAVVPLLWAVQLVLCTVSVVAAILSRYCAAIVALPACSPVASPLLFTVATPVAGSMSVAVHVVSVVTSCRVPSLKLPVAVNCC